MSEVQQAKPLWQRIGWLITIWAGSVLALAVVAYGLKLVMRAAGLGTP
jgi:hypothetical protein